jgi:hypothetical protein
MDNRDDDFVSPPFWDVNAKGYAVLCIACVMAPGILSAFGLLP